MEFTTENYAAVVLACMAKDGFGGVVDRVGEEAILKIAGAYQLSDINQLSSDLCAIREGAGHIATGMNDLAKAINAWLDENDQSPQ